MIDADTCTEIAEAAERAWAKINRDPERIGELSDDDLTSLATQVKTAAPILEAALVGMCGSVEKANATIERVFACSQEMVVRLIRVAHIRRLGGGELTESQVAALVLDTKAGLGAVTVEFERRAARKAGRMN